MYKEKPWTLEERKLTVRETPYVKNAKSDLAISTSKVQRLFKENKEKVYSNDEIARVLGLSIGTTSDITNRLQAIGDIKLVKVRQKKSALAQLFQHISGSLPAVTKERGKEDVVVSVYSLFCSNVNKLFTRKELMKNLDNTESKVRRALQILLLDEKIKLVGRTSETRTNAAYQHCNGNEQGFKIFQEEDENYCTLADYFKTHKEYKNRRKEVEKNLRNKKYRLFYSSKGILVEYLKEDINKAINNLNKKGILDKLFN